ncbi:hypothetical protein MASR2M66_11440 [Chloroflexota bacterium]|jgi:hypothetical protein
MTKKEEELQKAVSLINEKPLIGVFLRSSAACGMITTELAALDAEKDRVDVTDKALRNTLSKMTNLVTHGLSPFFVTSSRNVEGRSGPKLKTYLLTEFGKHVIEKLHPNMSIRYLHQPGEIAINHRFCQLEIYTLARKQGWQAEIEKVIPYGVTRSIRPDVTLNTSEGPIYIEIEQTMKKDRVFRAEEKIRNWTDYHSETGEIPEVLFMFNLREKMATETLSFWKDVLARTNTPLVFSYMLMSALRSNDNLKADLLHHQIDFVPEFISKHNEETAGDWQPPEAIVDLLSDMAIQLEAQIEVKEQLAQFKTSRTPPLGMEYASLIRMLEAAKYIWDIDFTFKDGGLDNNKKESIRKALDIPDNSISMLRYYLHHPLNRDLRERLKNLHTVARRQANAITLYRMTLNTIVLEFLEYFRITEVDGLFNVPVVIPDHSAKTSRPKVQVTISNDLEKYVPTGTAGQIQEYITALSWVLQCLILYPDKLGLI